MKRWEALIWFAVAFMFIGIGSLIIYTRYNKPEQEIINEATYTINPNRILDSSGHPKATFSPEDVIVEQNILGKNIFTLKYDYQTKNRQIEFLLEGELRQIRYISKTEQFFYYNSLDKVWDEVDVELLHQDYKDSLLNIDEIIFFNRQLEDFHRLASREGNIICKRDTTSKCVTWIAVNYKNFDEVVIYVNIRTAKIDQIYVYNRSNNTDSSPIIADYYYRELDIQPPAEDEVRYLFD